MCYWNTFPARSTYGSFLLFVKFLTHLRSEFPLTSSSNSCDAIKRGTNKRISRKRNEKEKEEKTKPIKTQINEIYSKMPRTTLTRILISVFQGILTILFKNQNCKYRKRFPLCDKINLKLEARRMDGMKQFPILELRGNWIWSTSSRQIVHGC